MTLDHLALRTKDREAASRVLIVGGYRIAEEFLIPEIGARSYAMVGGGVDIFISEGDPGSIVDTWITERGQQTALHHVAYATTNIEEWMQRSGWEFQTGVITCPCAKPMRQVFSKPQNGIVIEFIERNGHPGFCLENVKELMRGSAKV